MNEEIASAYIPLDTLTIQNEHPTYLEGVIQGSGRNGKYHIETMGCQMNIADSQRLASELERLGFNATDKPEAADIIVVNTCVVRQGAEDKGSNYIWRMRTLKRDQPGKIVGVMGCLVGVKDPLPLRKKFPHVDVFMSPSEPGPMVRFLKDRGYEEMGLIHDSATRAQRDAIIDEDIPYSDALILPAHERNNLVSAHVPVVYGCSHACAFCIIPFRRGVERSRSVGEIVADVRSLVRQGVKEITLLGQIVDRYGKDVPDGPDLADLIRIVHDTLVPEGLQRIRFLTSHPNWMSDKLLDTVAALPHVMPQIEVPIQAGDDDVLLRMKRGYTQAQYRALVARIRERVPDVAIHTDVIVGFPGETEAQFEQTLQVLAELKLDKVHLARYSERPNTVSARTMPDDVSAAEKDRRFRVTDDQQAGICGEINERMLGRRTEILVEVKHGDKWRGRTPQNKLVFFEDDTRNWCGEVVELEIVHTSPWSMQGRLPK